jgi:hypothetical protein
MSEITSVWFAIGLDIAMIIYTLLVISLGKKNSRFPLDIGVGMLSWLAVLHLGLSTKSIFPADISGIAFLVIVFVAVGAVGGLLFLVPKIRDQLLALDQQQLMLMQGIRVFFGANFLMMASVGSLPKTFGILDGWTHISAGFFGLIAAFVLARGADGIRRTWFANIFGVADILVVASTLSLVLLPDITPYHTMMYAVFLPAPLWLWFHIVSIWKLVENCPVVNQEVNV